MLNRERQLALKFYNLSEKDKKEVIQLLPLETRKKLQLLTEEIENNGLQKYITDDVIKNLDELIERGYETEWMKFLEKLSAITDGKNAPLKLYDTINNLLAQHSLEK